MNVTVITILRDGTHLDHWAEIEGDSVVEATEQVVDPHVIDRLEFYGENVKRLVVIAADLCWKIDLDRDQHLRSAPAPQLVAKVRA